MAGWGALSGALQGLGNLGSDIQGGRDIAQQRQIQQQAQQLQMLNYQMELDRMKQQQQQWQAEWPVQQQLLQNQAAEAKSRAAIMQDPNAWYTQHFGAPPSNEMKQLLPWLGLGMNPPAGLFKQTSLEDLKAQYADQIKKDDMAGGMSEADAEADALTKVGTPRGLNQLDLIAASLKKDAQGNPTSDAQAATAILNKQIDLTGEKRQPQTEEIQLTPNGPFMRLREAPAGTPVGTPGTYTPKGTKEVWTIEGPSRAAPRPPAKAQQIPPADIHFLNIANKIFGQNFPYTKTGAAAAKDYVKNQMISPSKQDLDSAKSSLATANKDIGTYVTAMGKEGLLQSVQGFVAPHSFGWIKPPQAIQDAHDKAVASATEAAIKALNSGQQVPMEIQTYVDTSKLAAANKQFMQIMQGRQIQQEGGIPPEDTSTTDTDTDTDSNAQ